MDSAESMYDEQYYRTHCGSIPYERSSHFLGFFGGVADAIIRSFAPQTVFDAGCAIGMLVESLWDRGVSARGRDISSYAIAQSRADIRPFLEVGSLVDPIPGRFDLVTCIEVLEHLSAADADVAIEHLCAATDAILFSSSPNDLTEPTHINVLPPIAWIERFATRGFGPDLELDPTFLAPHAMVFRRGLSIDRPILRGYAELCRWRMLAAERLEAIAYERNEARIARNEAHIAGLAGKENDPIAERLREELRVLNEKYIGVLERAVAAEAALREPSRADGERDADQATIARMAGQIDGLQRSLARMNDVIRELIIRETEAADANHRRLQAERDEIMRSPIVRVTTGS